MAKKSKASKRRSKKFSKKNRDKRSIESVAYEPLEPKHLLAAITVGSATDLSNAPDTSSITALIANDGGDGISLREAITAANNTTGEDAITFDTSVFTGGDNSVIRLTQGELEINDSLVIDSGGGITIDAQGNSRVMNFTASTGDLTLNGLTIASGQTESEENGGGILFASDGMLKLTASAITGNATGGGITNDIFDLDGGNGGGIYARVGSVSLTDSMVTDNSTGAGANSDRSDGGDAGDGGGIFASSVSLTNSTVSGNSTGGGGNYSGYGTPYGNGLYFLNDAGDGGDGGGIYATTVTLTNSTVSGNFAGDGGIVYGPFFGGGGNLGANGDGGGIFTTSGAVTLTNSTVSGNGRDNYGGGYGGGIRTGSGSVFLTNSTISGNAGRGISTSLGNVSLTNSTISNNSLGVFIGSGSSNSSVVVNNSIVAANGQFVGGVALDLRPVPGLLLTINYSLIGRGDNLGTIDGIGNLIGTIASPLDPLIGPLADNGGPTLTHALMPGSPAFDAGSNVLAIDENGNLLTTDQRGEVRGTGLLTRLGTVDIGAFEEESEANAEVLSLIVTTGQDVDDRFDGVTSLREAVAFANTPFAGVNNDGDADGDGFAADTITFDASVFTGGDNSAIRLTRGELEINATLSIDGTSVGGVVITGDANDDDVTIGSSHVTDVAESFGGDAGAASDLLDDNSRVLNFSDSTGNLTLTGLIITGGRTTGLRDEGGGIFFGSNSELSLNNSAVSGNSTTGFGSVGGGIYTRSGAVSLIDSTLSDNSTTGRSSDGGGIYARSGNVSLVNSTLSSNSTTGGGSFSTESNGGGISTRSGAVSMVNSTLSGNSTTGRGDGGGIFTRSGDVSLRNSTLTANSTLGFGGGIFATNNLDKPSLTIANSIVAGNFVGSTPNDLVLDPEAARTINHSLIGVSDNLAISGGNNLTGTAFLPLDPLLGPLADNGGSTLTHALLPGSPAIDAGNNALAVDENGDPLTTDQRGEARIESSTVDIGAVESESEGPFLLGDADLSGAVDFADIPAFIDALLSGTFVDEADTNRDGIVDFADIPAFIDVLLNGGSPQVLLGDADLSGVVDFADIPAFIDVLLSDDYLNEADIDRNGVVDFADIPLFIDVLLSGGSTAVTSQSIVVAPPVSSAASLVSVIESELIASVAATVEVPLTSETSDAIAESVGLAEPVEYDSPELVEAAVPIEMVPPPRNVPDQVAASEPASIEASQLIAVESLPPLVAPQFNSSTSNLPTAPAVASTVEDRSPEPQAVSSSTPLSLVGGVAGIESRFEDRPVLASDSESDQPETEVVDLLDETFATYEDDLDVVFS